MSRITQEYAIHQRKARPNLDISHRCVFKCPQCVRQKIISQDQIKRSFDMDKKNLKKILNYYNNDTGINFCGQISDPIYHPNFLNFLKMCDEEKMKIRVSTVGSGKSDAWWEEAFSYNIGTSLWYFGVDGIDEKSELYRIGSNFKDVWSRMQRGRDLGHNIVWQYIIFRHNEEDMDRAIDIAKLEEFTLMFINTNRGYNSNNPLLRDNTEFNIKKPSDKYQERWKKLEWYGHTTKSFLNFWPKTYEIWDKE